MDNTFVRKDFYLEPPSLTAGPEEWQEWLRQDNLKARGAKAAFTRSQKAQDCDNPRLNRTGMVKLGGVWRQSTALYSGSAEDGTLVREVACDATQEIEAINVRRLEDYRHKRGNARKSRNRNRRAKRRASKRSNFR